MRKCCIFTLLTGGMTIFKNNKIISVVELLLKYFVSLRIALCVKFSVKSFIHHHIHQALFIIPLGFFFIHVNSQAMGDQHCHFYDKLCL